MGRNGEFDIMAASVIKQIQRDRGTGNHCLILVLPYMVADTTYLEAYYNEVILPLELYHVYYKSAITKRNEWIITNSDLMIMYVAQTNGNAAKCMKKARDIGKQIIYLR
jgi:hypothetical protein